MNYYNNKTINQLIGTILSVLFFLHFAFDISGQNGDLVVEGKVGIGTSHMGKALEVYGNVVTKATNVGGTAGAFTAGTDGIVSFWTNNSYNPSNHTSGWKRTMNLIGGDVGIGTTEPQGKLHVLGGTGAGTFSIVGESTAGWGVYGYSESGTGISGIGGVFSTEGIGVYGWGKSADFWAQTGTYGNSSSIRWKRNILSISNPIDKLLKIRGVYFDWDEKHGGKHTVGFIAEEVGEVLPEIVIYEDNGVDARGMDYSKMSALLVEASKAMRQEYQKKFNDQEQRIKKLEQELTLLKQIILKLE